MVDEPDTMKILEVRGDRRAVEISDIRVMEDGRGITFTICPLQAVIEHCDVDIYKILPEPVERKLLRGLITLRKEREFLGGRDILIPDAEGLEPLKRYRVCLYTKGEGEEACEEDVECTVSMSTGKTIERDLGTRSPSPEPWFLERF